MRPYLAYLQRDRLFIELSGSGKEQLVYRAGHVRFGVADGFLISIEFTDLSVEVIARLAEG